MSRGICSDPIKELERHRKIREALKGKTKSEEHKLNMSKSRLGKHPSEETKKLWSSQRKGVPKSDEWKKKIAESHTGLHYPRSGFTRKSNIEHHHVKYKEIHGEDVIVELTHSEHVKLHARLRKEGKCTVPPAELRKISSDARNRRFSLDNGE